MTKVQLRELAHSRTGDKGDISNVSVICYNPADYELVKTQVTVEKVKEHFSEIVQGEVIRYELPNIAALNFVMHKALGGGVTRSLRIDAHGKCLSSSMLQIEVERS